MKRDTETRTNQSVINKWHRLRKRLEVLERTFY